MEDYRVRQLTVDDLDELLRLEEACFSSPWSRESYRRELTENNLAHYWGVFAGGELIGFAGYWLILDEGHITNVAVAPDRRNQGVGRFLVQGVINGCLAGGGRFLTLEVRASNAPALHLYEKMGFVSSGVRPKYYDDPKEDAVIMWKELCSSPAAGEAEHDQNTGNRIQL
ncbi:MAG: ribosomal protein S18-alanine N-acetyltransferase [Firmicutes bacterium]|nr:ribosomal protein S18-alanine N-acetyltransferase [Bacillota bacterium]